MVKSCDEYAPTIGSPSREGSSQSDIRSFRSVLFPWLGANRIHRGTLSGKHCVPQQTASIKGQSKEDSMVSGLNRQVFTRISSGLYIVTSLREGKQTAK